MKIGIFSLFLASLMAFAFRPAAQEHGEQPSLQLWYWHHSYLTNDAAVASSKALIDRAAAAGYTGVAFWDSSFNFMSNSSWPWQNEDRMREVMKYAARKHLKCIAPAAPFGWSNDVLSVNPNWAEASRVIGAQFVVDPSGKQLNFKNSLPRLANPSFESGKTDWFSIGDSGVGLSESAHYGKYSAAIVDAPGNARLRQHVTLKPWRQYYLRVLFKSSGFSGGPMVEVLDQAHSNRVVFNANIRANGTHDWTELDYLFNSQDSTDDNLYLGVWGGSSGTLLFDDIALEETALVYVEHRDGAPFKLYDPSNPAKIYQPGIDYSPVADPDMQPQLPAFHNVFHNPPVVRLPAGTHLSPGQTVAADFYAVTPLPISNETAMCLTEPAVYKWLTANAHSIKKVLPDDSAILLSYDELRQANSCFLCRSKKMTAGQLLAGSFEQTYGIYRSAAPNASIFVWSDMFDPYHNAHSDYFYVEGDLAGSWKGLAGDVSIMNWNLDHLRQSLLWFSGNDRQQPVAHKQMIAGFYDRGDGAKLAAEELQQAAGIPGLQGLMYTTYEENYSQLEKFATGARSAWPKYLASVPSH